MNNKELLIEAKKIASEAGGEIMKFYKKDFNLDYKDKGSPLTEADLASNTIIVKKLKEMNFALLSEEEAEDGSRFDADRVWVVDPMDGTKDFINQTGEFTVMMALVEKNKQGKFRPIVAVIYQPAKEVFYTAIKGEGAYIEEGGQKRKIEVDKESEMKNIVMLTSHNHSTELEENLAKHFKVSETKKFGSSLKACLIADKQGHFNCNPAPYTWEYDVCASDLIIHEAGGRFTDTEGEIISYNKKDPRNNQGYLASNGEIHNPLIEKIKDLKS